MGFGFGVDVGTTLTTPLPSCLPADSVSGCAALGEGPGINGVFGVDVDVDVDVGTTLTTPLPS